MSTVYEISYELPDSFERYVEGAILEGVQYSAFRGVYGFFFFSPCVLQMRVTALTG